MIERILIIIWCCLSSMLYAQVPAGISFQAVVRDDQGAVLSEQTIKVRISVLEGSANGTVVYAEEHSPITNNAGLFTLIIGNGTALSGAFGDIDWSNGNLYIKREIDPTGGNNFVISGASALQTIPYSFYSNLADSSRVAHLADSVVSKQQLTLSNDTIYLSDGGYVKLPSGTVDTDQQGLSAMRSGNQVTINIERGSGATFTDQVNDADADTTNEIQTISKMDRTVTLSDNGGSFVDSILTEAQVDAFANNNGYLTTEMDGDSTNELQVLSITNDTIYLSDGGYVKLPSGTVDTDQQGLSAMRSGNQVTINIERGSGATFTDQVNDADADTTNEIQTISKMDRTVTLSDNGGSFVDSILTEAQVDAFANNNGYLTTEMDGDSTNEIQVLSISNDTIYLSDGGYAKLPGDTVPSASNNGQFIYRNQNKWDTLSVGLPGQQLIIDENGLPKWTGDAYPTVSTVSTSNISATSVSVSVNITSDGGQSVSSRGVVYGTSDNPTLSNFYQVSGSGTGSFNVTVNNLTPSTTYYVRGYATNSVGTGYGSSLNFTTTAPTLPVLSTNAVSSITQTTAVSGGVISSDGGSAITARGVVWSISPGPTISNNKTQDGAGTGNFSSTLTGLTDNTTYYVRSCATNSVGTAYGNELSFTTAALTVPILTTNTVVNITNTSAQSGGMITSDGGSAISAKGVVWSTNTNPTLSDNSTSDGTGTSSYNSVLTGLSDGVTYYVRAYATNSSGTGYGDQKSFTSASTANTIATVVLDSVGSIETTAATAYAEITAEGGGSITERGIVWNTSSAPTVNNNKISSGTGSGVFSALINSGLQSNRTYYVRAYAVNNYGIAYSNELSFTTITGLPTLTTNLVTASSETATSGGNITDDGGSSITARGVVWSTSSTPTINDNKTEDGTGTGNYNSTLTGLMPSTLYYVRAYATNSTGAGYGEERSFTTSAAPSTVTDIDGNVYNTVQIGDQVWMKENLKTSRYNTGSAIPYVVDNGSWSGLSTGAWSYYNHDENNNAIYGKLYNWYAVEGDSLCPTGWHVPTDAEWTILTDTLGAVSVAGGKLKEVGTVHWNSPNTGATDEVGFTALPGGYRSDSGSFDFALETSIRNYGYWWSATPSSSDRSWNRNLTRLHSYVWRPNESKRSGFSVRCLRD